MVGIPDVVEVFYEYIHVIRGFLPGLFLMDNRATV